MPDIHGDCGACLTSPTRPPANDAPAKLRGLHDRSLRFWFISLSAPHRLEDVHDEHLELFRLLRERDAEGARQAVRKHIESFRSALFNRL